MRRAILIAAMAAAAIVVGAATALNPKTLVLQRSDMPSGAKRVSFGTSKGAIKIPRVVKGKAAYVGWRFRNGSSTENVAAAAGILASTRDAHDVLVHVKKSLKKTTFKRAAVPRYGDEQFAVSVASGGLGSALVFVRSGTRLWEVVVFGYPRFSRARAVGQLKKYAAKERARAT